jgi:LysM repeat protein
MIDNLLKLIKSKRHLLFIVIMTVSLSLPVGTSAQSETPHDLVNAVNSLRAIHGLEPYQIDPRLMAYAQEHSEYMAAIQTGTHLHSDGTLPQDIGLKENVASGDIGLVTVAVVVNEIWVDWGHRHILVDYPTGEIGAGIAVSENGQVYYTVNIRPGEQAATATWEPGTTVPSTPIETSVPSEDGGIFHIVQPGETMWGIAQSYGVTVDDIRRLNGIADGSTLIHPGQQLIISPGGTRTQVITEESAPASTQVVGDTPVPFTETALPSEFGMPSPSLTSMPTSIQSETSQDHKGFSWGGILTIGILVLITAAILGYMKFRADKPEKDRE